MDTQSSPTAPRRNWAELAFAVVLLLVVALILGDLGTAHPGRVPPLAPLFATATP
jgi:hypothetical protein